MVASRLPALSFCFRRCLQSPLACVCSPSAPRHDELLVSGGDQMRGDAGILYSQTRGQRTRREQSRGRPTAAQAHPAAALLCFATACVRATSKMWSAIRCWSDMKEGQHTRRQQQAQSAATERQEALRSRERGASSRASAQPAEVSTSLTKPRGRNAHSLLLACPCSRCLSLSFAPCAQLAA